MAWNLLGPFIVLNIVNVILQTLKTILTVNGNKYTAAVMNAIAFGFYTVVVIYMLSDLPIWLKASIVGLCNLIGVFIVKYFEELNQKDRLWKIEFAIKNEFFKEVVEYLNKKQVSYNYAKMPHHYVSFYAFCTSKGDSEEIKNIIQKFGAKYFVTESKLLF